MIAVAVMAIGVGAALEGWARLHAVRSEVIERQEVQALTGDLASRLMGSQGEELGTGWSTARPDDAPTSPGYTAAELEAVGIGSAPRAVENLRIHIDYFRGLAANGRPGLLQEGTGDHAGAATDPAFLTETLDRFVVAAADTSAYRLTDAAGNLPPGAAALGQLDDIGQIGIYDPVVIRITAYWGPLQADGRPVFRHVQYLSRRPYRDG